MPHQQTRTVNGVNEHPLIDQDGPEGSQEPTLLAYDHAGNLTIDPTAPLPTGPGGHKYVYDEENRVTKVHRANHTAAPEDDVLLAEYEYDALGRRVQSIEYIDAATGATLATPRKTRHVYVGIETIEEYDITGNPGSETQTLLREFLWGDPMRFPEPLALVTQGGASGGQGGAGVPAGESVYHYLHDALGSVVGLTDSTGVLVERYTYDPYGRTLVETGDGQGGWTANLCGGSAGASPSLCYSAFGNPFMWTGQRYEPVSGLYAFYFRAYSPSLGRWLQRDPIGYAGGSVNLYEYVFGSPLDLIDPFGLDGCDKLTDPGGIDDTLEKLRGMKDKGVYVVERTWNGRKYTLIHLYDGSKYLGTILCPQPSEGGGIAEDADYQRCLQTAEKYAKDRGLLESAKKAAGAAYAAGYFIIIAGSLAVPGPDDLLLGAAGAVKAAGLVGKAVKLLKKAEKAEDAAADAAKAAKAAKKAEGKLHHLATNKNRISTARGGPWTPRFEEIFEKGGMTLEDGLNKLRVPGHYGPHPEAYHQAVFDRLTEATEGLEGQAYADALRTTLDKIGQEAATVGSDLNKLLTGG